MADKRLAKCRALYPELNQWCVQLDIEDIQESELINAVPWADGLHDAKPFTIKGEWSPNETKSIRDILVDDSSWHIVLQGLRGERLRKELHGLISRVIGAEAAEASRPKPEAKLDTLGLHAIISGAYNECICRDGYPPADCPVHPIKPAKSTFVATRFDVFDMPTAFEERPLTQQICCCTVSGGVNHACPIHGTVDQSKKPGHVCGLQGFGRYPTDTCPACEYNRKQREGEAR